MQRKLQVEVAPVSAQQHLIHDSQNKITDADVYEARQGIGAKAQHVIVDKHSQQEHSRHDKAINIEIAERYPERIRPPLIAMPPLSRTHRSRDQREPSRRCASPQKWTPPSSSASPCGRFTPQWEQATMRSPACGSSSLVFFAADLRPIPFTRRYSTKAEKKRRSSLLNLGNSSR